MSKDRLILVAKIVGVHGIRGLVKVRFFSGTTDSADIDRPFFNKQGDRLPKFMGKSFLKGNLLVLPEGVVDRNAAERFVGQELYIKESQLQALKPDEFYHDQLLGLGVYNENDEFLGEVCDVQNFGAGDILDIKTQMGTHYMCHFSKQVVLEVDLESKRLKVVSEHLVGAD